MQAPSLYSHFASKNAIYDAMFGEAWAEYDARRAEAADGCPRARGRDHGREGSAVLRLRDCRPAPLPADEPADHPRLRAVAGVVRAVAARRAARRRAPRRRSASPTAATSRSCSPIIGRPRRPAARQRPRRRQPAAAARCAPSRCGPTASDCRQTHGRARRESDDHDDDQKLGDPPRRVGPPPRRSRCGWPRPSTSGSPLLSQRCPTTTGSGRPTAPAGTCTSWSPTCVGMAYDGGVVRSRSYGSARPPAPARRRRAVRRRADGASRSRTLRDRHARRARRR